MNIRQSPKVSVNMPCFNCNKYVGEAITSILNQTFTNFELIIINDRSTDNSVEVIKSFKDKRIRLLHNERNSGIAITRNKAIAESRGEFIAILDSDDIAYPTRLEEQVLFMEKNPDFGMIGSWIEVIDENSHSTNEIRITPGLPEQIPSLSLFQNCFAQSSVLIRKSALPDEWYRSEFAQAEDYDLWLRIALTYKVTNLQKTLVKYRIHSSNISKDNNIMTQSLRVILHWQLNKLGITPSYDELSLHLIFFGFGKKPKDFLQQAEIWLLKLLKANQGKKIYNEKTFQTVIGNLWLSIISHESVSNLLANKTLLFSPLTRLIKQDIKGKKFLFIHYLTRIMKKLIKKT